MQSNGGSSLRVPRAKPEYNEWEYTGPSNCFIYILFIGAIIVLIVAILISYYAGRENGYDKGYKDGDDYGRTEAFTFNKKPYKLPPIISTQKVGEYSRLCDWTLQKRQHTATIVTPIGQYDVEEARLAHSKIGDIIFVRYEVTRGDDLYDNYDQYTYADSRDITSVNFHPVMDSSTPPAHPESCSHYDASY